MGTDTAANRAELPRPTSYRTDELPHAVRAVLDADARAGRARRLRDRVVPRALAASAHDDQVTVSQLVPQRLAAAEPRTQMQRAGRAHRQDRDHGVFRQAPTDAIAVPRDAVAPIAVVAQA